VRLDSGDIHYLSVEVRKMLDAAGLTNATITVSNDLNEYIIKTLTDDKTPVNIWGVGTSMVTGGNEAAFTGIYKLAASGEGKEELTAKMKFSDNPEKTTNPGVKQVWRITDGGGSYIADVLGLEDPLNPDIIEKGKSYTFWHPQADYRHFIHRVDGGAEQLLKIRLKDGALTGEAPSLDEIRSHVRKGLESLDQSYKRILNPHIYKVSVTRQLRDLKLELIQNYLGELRT
jgi:nicotinate phosphoribosyltransferase